MIFPLSFLLPIVVVTLAVFVSASTEPTNSALCVNHYPAGETAMALDKIVEQYGQPQMIPEKNGYQRRVMIIDADEFVIDGQRYSTQPLLFSDSSTCTFRFETHRYFRSPDIFVNADRRRRSLDLDAIEPFNRLHFRCPTGTRCCGLYCCPNETKHVQEKFIELSDPMTDDSHFRLIDRRTSVSHNSTNYSLSVSSSFFDGQTSSRHTACMYALKDEDKLYRTLRLENDEPVKYIYYTCPPSYFCCQLRCVPAVRISPVNQGDPQSGLVMMKQGTSFSFDKYDMFLLAIPATLLVFIFLACGVFSFRLRRAAKARQRAERLEQLSYEEHFERGALV